VNQQFPGHEAAGDSTGALVVGDGQPFFLHPQKEAERKIHVKK